MTKTSFDLLVNYAHNEREAIRSRSIAGIKRVKRLEDLRKAGKLGEYEYEKMLEQKELQVESIVDYVSSFSAAIRYCEDDDLKDGEIVERLNVMYGQPGERIWTVRGLKRFRQVSDMLQFAAVGLV